MRTRIASIFVLACLLGACGGDGGGGSGGGTLEVDAVTGLPAGATVLVATDNGRQLYYAAPGVAEVEIHLDKPWGQRIARFTGDRGRTATGDWIRDGMRFYLQDVSNSRPLTLQHTLATAIATVDANTAGRAGVILGATPGLVPDPANTGRGTATLFWNAPGSSAVEVRVNSPDGPLFAREGPVGSRSSGNWITDGMRFYLQDASSADSTSAANTLAVATVDLQPSQQRYLSYYNTDGGVLVHSRDSMHRLGAIAPDALPVGVTATDMHPSPDGTLLYLLGSDFNYHVLDPADDSVRASFPAGSQGQSFGFMKGMLNEDLLIAAPDDRGNIAIVDPAQRSVVAVLNCPCHGSVSGIMDSRATNTAFFVSVAPSTPPTYPPMFGLSRLVLYSVAPNLHMAAPFPLPLPPAWGADAVEAGASFLLLSVGTQETLLVTWSRLVNIRIPPGPSDVVAYDLASRTMTTLTPAFTLDAGVNVPELASPDGTSIYAQPFVLMGSGPDQSGTRMPGDLARFAATPGAAQPYAPAATFPMDAQPTLITPPFALDDRYVFFGQVSIVGASTYPWSSQPSSPFYLYRAERSTLQPIGSARIIVDNSPRASNRAPLVGLSIGSYDWPKTPLVAR